jgi:hypothetical protein
MVYINDLQRETLILLDRLIDEGENFNEVWWSLQSKGYRFQGERRNGYDIKTRFYLLDKDGKPSFVWLKKRRNGLATWETIKLS